MKYKIITPSNLPNIPWQNKPEGSTEIIWRYTQNPIIPRDLLPKSNSIFNSAVVPFEGEFRGVFRVDNKERKMCLHAGRSKDGLNWDIEENPIQFICDIEEIATFDEGYDPRVTYLEGKYYISWCNVYNGYTIGLGWTTDFSQFHQLENAFLPWNRNGVIFPRKINGNFAMLSRPSDTGHTPFGDIFYSESPDMTFWGKHRHVMRPTVGWQSKKVGAGPVPIETEEGWLLIYHGVLNSCNGFVYGFGAALLDREEPWKVLYRSKSYLIHPTHDYERVGDVPNVCFPCAALHDSETGKIAIYYGGADTVTAIAFSYIDDIIDALKAGY